MLNRGAGAAVLKDHLFRIVDALGELRLPYMVIGAFALPAWGRPRATLDLDFSIQTAEVPQSLVKTLNDLVLTSRDEHDVAAFSRRKKKRFDGRYLWFPSAEDLLLQKLKVGRPQDFIDAAGIAERMRGKLDRPYLARWAKKLRVTAELAHILNQ